jgi:hypothetical protein
MAADQIPQPAPGPGLTSEPSAGPGTAPTRLAAGIGWARWADAGLWAVACSGFALSYSSVQRAALAHVDHAALSYLLPVATDGGALAAAARYVADRRAGMAAARGWQLLAWAAIAASAALNAMGRDWQDAVWHLVGPAALAVITELYAHRAAQLHRRELHQPAETIPARLWMTAPVASARLWLWVARTGQRSLIEARAEMGRNAAALQALAVDCPGRDYRRLRRTARRQLRAGALPPVAVLDVLGWAEGRLAADPPAALRTLLAAALAPTARPRPIAEAISHPTTDPTMPTDQASEPIGPIGPTNGPNRRSDRPQPIEARTQPIGQPSDRTAPIGRQPRRRIAGPTTPTDPDAAHDAEILAAIRGSAPLPSVWAIRTTHRVGPARAARLRAAAETDAAHTRPRTDTTEPEQPSVTAMDLRSIPAINGTSHHNAIEKSEQESTQ